MNEPSPVTEGGAPAGISPGALLEGHRLLLARIAWAVVAFMVVVLSVVAFPDLYRVYFVYSPQQLQQLQQLNMSPMLYSVLGIVLNAIVFQAVFLLLGLLLFLRRSDEPVALFCAFTLVTFSSAATVYDFNSGDVVPALTANPIEHVLSLVLFGVGETSLIVFFYLFPSGRFVPRWTRWAAVLVAAYYVAVIFVPRLPSNAGGPATYAVPLFLLTAVVAQIYRYRRVSTPKEQEQTKWAVFGFVLAILLIAVNVPLAALLPASLTNSPLFGNLNPTFPVALSMIPIFIVIAILRSRLWDIDTLINRALVYGSLTALLGLLYAGLIVGLERLASLVAGPTATSPVSLVISTLVIAALFQPLRTRIQAFIDRAFYRQKYDATQTLAAFGVSLGQEVDLEQIREYLLAVTSRTLQPAHVSLWLRPPPAGRPSGEDIASHQRSTPPSEAHLGS